jgi:hypothetical protein
MGVTVVTGGNSLNVTTSQRVVTGSGTVENSDASYQETVNSGETVVIPDITITKNDDSKTTAPAAKDLDLRIIDPCDLPSTWNEMVAEYGQTYNYPPPTGQTTIYRTGDDAYVEQNIFASVRAANGLKVKNSLVNFTTLLHNNAFGNTNRFTDDAGGQDYANDYVIDHFTGMGWVNKNGVLPVDNWNNQIDAAFASTHANYSGWFLCNANQFLSICDWESGSNATNYSPFNIGFSNQRAHLSTSDEFIVGRIMFVEIDSTPVRPLLIDQTFATNTYYGIICRKHY